MRTPLLRSAPAIVMLLASALPLSAEGLEQAAARERGRRETSVADPSRAFTDDDLGPNAAERFPKAASQRPSDQPPAASEPLPYAEATRQDAYGRHWTSAQAYVKQCEQRLRAANDSWFAAGKASLASDATLARLAVGRAARALERAEDYRDQAEVVARLAGAGLR